MDPGTISLDVAIENLRSSFVGITRLVTAASYVIGIALIFRGVAMYRIFANQTFGSAQRGEFAGPLVFLIVGAFLMYLPSTLDTGLNTMYGNTELAAAGDLMSYQPLTARENWNNLSDVLISYVRLIGLIAFIRGLLILSKMGHPGSQPGSVAKGLTHLVGGILLINVVETVNILAATFGVS